MRRPDRTADPVLDEITKFQRVLSISTMDGNHPMTGSSLPSHIRNRRSRIRIRRGTGICRRIRDIRGRTHGIRTW